MADPSHRPAGPDTSAAVQVADLVVMAADLIAGQETSEDLVDRLATALRHIQGVHAIRESPAASTRRTQLLLGPPSPRAPSGSCVVVELADQHDEEWMGPGQQRRLASALSVIEAATFEAGDAPAERLSTLLLRHARSVVVQLGRDRWSARSEAFTRVLGHPADVVHSMTPLSLVDPRDRVTALRAYVEAVTGRCHDQKVELRVFAADGSPRVLESTFVNLKSAPDVGTVVLYGLDVTERRGEQARLRELVMRLTGAVLIVDEGDRVRLANDAFTRVFGTRAGGWVGREHQEALHAVMARCVEGSGARERLRSLVKAARRTTTRVSLTDGRTIEVDRVPLAEQGVDLGSMWYFRDVTTAVATATDDRSGQDAVAVQNRVLSTVSHELRTPLTAVLSFAELLADPAIGALNDDQRAATDVIARNTRRLLSLVDDLLLLSRLEGRQLPLRRGPVDLTALVADAVRDRELEAQGAGLTITSAIHNGPPLWGDGGRLQQVLDNLLRNAIKFSCGGGSIQVVARHADGQWAVEVRDAGIGIPAEDLATITQGFERGSNAVTAGIPGSGLGLAVCREIVELHHGTLTIDSTLNVGTTVLITLPQRKEGS